VKYEKVTAKFERMSAPDVSAIADANVALTAARYVIAVIEVIADSS
jgi:hypothetical protein